MYNHQRPRVSQSFPIITWSMQSEKGKVTGRKPTRQGAGPLAYRPGPGDLQEDCPGQHATSAVCPPSYLSCWQLQNIHPIHRRKMNTFVSQISKISKMLPNPRKLDQHINPSHPQAHLTNHMPAPSWSIIMLVPMYNEKGRWLACDLMQDLRLLVNSWELETASPDNLCRKPLSCVNELSRLQIPED